ncbi:MAG TPA: PAS domain S-box protein [Solirubrobacteraceae bacterium]|nr:PAS domain S-box protein [Solirubrobacteraceae bacterium]
MARVSDEEVISVLGIEDLGSALIRSSVDALVIVDDEGLITEFNPAAESILGYRREDAVGREMPGLLLAPEVRERVRIALRRGAAGGEAPLFDRPVEVPALRADGSRLRVELSIARLATFDPPLFGVYLRDLSRRRAVDFTHLHLAAIVESTDDAVLSKDSRGIVTSWNPGAERLYGYSVEEAIGRHVSFLVPSDHRGEEARILARAMTGERIETYETERIRADGTRVEVSLTVSPIVAGDEGVIGASVIARDITARNRAAQAQQLLANASAALDASLDPVETLRTIAGTTVPQLAELCIIDLLRDDGSIGGAVARATDAAIARELEGLRRRFPLDPAGRHPVAQVLRTGHSMALRDLTAPEIQADVAQSDEHLEFMRRADYHSAAVVPMVARGRLLGTISLLHVDNDRRYDPDDLALLEDLAGRAAMAFDNARLYAERSRVARTLQQSLLPVDLPAMPGFAVAASYQPAGEGNEVGGDFYDVFEHEGEWVVVVGDVCGKGAEAAAVTALIRNSVRAVALAEQDPSRILDQVNEVMLRHEVSQRFATAVVGRLARTDAGATARICAAGHPPPLVLEPGGGVRSQTPRGDLLGIRADAAFPALDVALHPGETLLLYTDGVLEAAAPRQVLSPEDLESIVGRCAGMPPREVVRVVEREALRLSAGSPRDDLAILAVTVR